MKKIKYNNRRKSFMSKAVLMLAVIMTFCCFGCNSNKGTAGNEKDSVTSDDLLSGRYYAEIDIKNYGVIKLELDADTAPVTVTNFVNLAESGFYNGLTFHRIIEGFMMQGGDPDGNGTGGSETSIKGEFSANGCKNDISHKRGVISMARRGDSYDSATSQFFIMHADADYLDGNYAAFGHVTEGLDVVDKICSEAEPVDSNGLIAADKQPVINSIKITK